MSTVNRREFLGITLGAGTALGLTPELLRAFQQSGGKLIQRAIPSTGEMLPVISFAPRPTAPRGPGEIKAMPGDVPAAKEVLKTFLEKGGRVVDVLHGGPIGEQAGRTAANDLGIQDKFFWTTPLTPAPDLVGTKGALEEKFATFKVPRIDLVMVGAGPDVATHLAFLREMKKAGRVRYIGVHTLLPPPNFPMGPIGATLESIMRTEQIDFIGTDYSVGDRRLEQTFLPLALERKIGVLAYFTFDRGRFFQRVGTTPVPEWAAEFDAKTWAQFSIKYVLSHPAVTMARTGTTNAAHMLDNIGGGIGRLPNEATRKRMAAFIDTLPPTPPPGPAAPPPGIALPIAIIDRYVGEYVAASGFTAIIRRDGATLFVKPGNNPEVPLLARSETRFQDPRGPFFEFQLDAQGKVTGAILEQQGSQGPQRIPLERKY